MIRLAAAMIAALGTSGIAQAQGTAPDGHLDDAALAKVRDAAVVALSFAQGDKPSLTDARDAFTGEGWHAFLDSLAGWLNDAGAPVFDSAFRPSGPTERVPAEAGSVRLSIPGILEHRQGAMSATYRVAVLLRLEPASGRIDAIQTHTCGNGETIDMIIDDEVVHLSCG